MVDQTYDVIIVGAGPAGISAAVYAARQKLKTVIISENIGGQAAWSGDIENYTGFQFIPGHELAKIFEDQVRKYPVDIIEFQRISKLGKTEEGLFVAATQEARYVGRTVILASGKVPRKLGVPGEEAFYKKGVTYCATCDGPFFAGKTVAVIGGGNSALDAALQLIKHVKKMYVINNLAQFTGEAVMTEKLLASPIVEVFHNAQVRAFNGQKVLNEMVFEVAGQEQRLAVEGVFIEIGLSPNSDYCCLPLAKNKYNEIIVDSRNQTSVSGVFAAGDVTDVPEKQIVVAAGEGAKAALSAIKHLMKLTENKKDKGGESKMAKYRCTVCDYIYDPAQNGNVSFESLPEDYTCPECGVGKDQFVIVE